MRKQGKYKERLKKILDRSLGLSKIVDATCHDSITRYSIISALRKKERVCLEQPLDSATTFNVDDRQKKMPFTCLPYKL